MTDFKRGDKVWIINTAYSGKFVVEGRATVVEPAKDGYEFSYVRFENDELGEPTVLRYINPDAQVDPKAHVAELNATRDRLIAELNATRDRLIAESEARRAAERTVGQ